MLSSSELPPRARKLTARLIHSTWRWINEVGSVTPTDPSGRRFRAMGTGSCISFPPGAMHGEHWITIGTGTLVAPHVSLAVGMPDEPLEQCSEAVLVIGNRCTIGRGTSIVARCRVEIEDDVTTGPNVYITDHNHTYAETDVPIGRQWPADDPVTVGRGSWLGTGVIVLPGASIGRNVTVGAGSVVRGRFPDHSVIAGTPARVVRRHVEGIGWVPPLKPRSIRAPEHWTAS